MVSKLSWDSIIELLLNAREQVVLIMPAIHEEWIQVLQMSQSRNQLNIRVCIDNSEGVIRSGYGSIESIEALKGLKATINECDGLRVNFISVDDMSYCLFLESRILAGDPDGYNAIELDPNASLEIINQFFPSVNVTEEAESISISLQETKCEEIKRSLDKNPPEKPDLKRKISTYITLFQYAELHFEGGNLSSKAISIPPDALPFKDVELKKRLKARISLFTKDITDKWTELTDMKAKVDQVRKEYLVSCNIRKDKSILKKENKGAFQKAITDLKSLTDQKMISLKNKVQTAINNAEDTLRNELTAFFALNPPDSIQGLDEENAKRQVTKEINTLISKIDLPDAELLISKIKIEEMYYEFTWEDLNDKKFKEWFVQKRLLSDEEKDKIASFRDAYIIRK